MDFDEELPAGFQDADLEMRELETAAMAPRKKCQHGWRRVWEDGKTAVCLNCGATFTLPISTKV